MLLNVRMIALHDASMVPWFSENGNTERVRNNEISRAKLPPLHSLQPRDSWLQAMHIMQMTYPAAYDGPFTP